MEFSLTGALVAGFTATLVLSALLRAAVAASMSEMPSAEFVMGTMFVPNEVAAMVLGAVVHYLLMGTVVFGLVYAGLFVLADTASLWFGLVVGLFHGMFVGVVAMPLTEFIHPRMIHADRTAWVGRGRSVSYSPGGELLISAPGRMGKWWGEAMPVVVVGAHLAYGLVMALVYDLLV